jgi:nucleoside-diphosphate-sugar epimerase
MNPQSIDPISTVKQLEDALSAPTPYVVDTMKRLSGDIIVLGIGGKMGPTLARMAKRASEAAGVSRRIIGVSRFSSQSAETELQAAGIETIRCDLLNKVEVDALPDAPNVVFMAGMKFGSTGQEALTWAMNAYVPSLVATKYKESRIVAFSTGNVYGLSPLSYGGSIEKDTLNPIGDYAMSTMARERMFEHFSRTCGTPVSLIRLNYATELRYGVLVDIARKVYSGEQIDLAMGNFNAIWQGDANAMTLGAFDRASSPPFILNVAGPEMLSVRRVAEQFGELMGKTPVFCGTESGSGMLSNGQLGHSIFGYPRVAISDIIKWTADWIAGGGEYIGKPTHFETRDGKY